MPDNSPCTCPVVWAFAPQAATITPGCPVHTRSSHYNEAVKAAAVAIGRAFNGDPLTWRAEAEAAVGAALPHLRAYQIEVQTRIGYALGRKEAAAEIAAAHEAEARRCRPGSVQAAALLTAARHARELGTKEAT